MGAHTKSPPRKTDRADKTVVMVEGIAPATLHESMDYSSAMNEYMIELRDARRCLNNARINAQDSTLSLQWSSEASVHAEIAQSLATLLISFGS